MSHAATPSASPCTCCIDRRRALAGVGVAGLGVAATLTGCSSSSSAADGASALDSDSTGASGATLLALADLPVGQMRVVTVQERQVVLHRISDTEVLSMSAHCPHQGCAVVVDTGQLICPCHESIFDSTGRNLSGPANGAALPDGPAVAIDGDSIVLA